MHIQCQSQSKIINTHARTRICRQFSMRFIDEKIVYRCCCCCCSLFRQIFKWLTSNAIKSIKFHLCSLQINVWRCYVYFCARVFLLSLSLLLLTMNCLLCPLVRSDSTVFIQIVWKRGVRYIIFISTIHSVYGSKLFYFILLYFIYFFP